MPHRFRWTLRFLCLPHFSWRMQNTNCGGVASPYTQRVSDELDYEEFNDTHLMTSLTLAVCVLPSHSFPLFLCIASHNDVHMGYSCQAGPTAGAPIDPPHLPWSVYVYGLDGFAHDRPVGRKTNVMGYPFLEGTRAMSLLRSCLFPFYSCIPTLVTTFSFKNSAHCTGAWEASLAYREPQAGDDRVLPANLQS